MRIFRSRAFDAAVFAGVSFSFLAGLLVLTTLGERSSIWVLFAAIALNSIGVAVAETVEATIMLETTPFELSGAVSAVKSVVGQAAYSPGPAVFVLIGTAVFAHSSRDELERAGDHRRAGPRHPAGRPMAAPVPMC